MPNQFPLDEIDAAPVHGGRHRIRRTSADRVREWFIVLTATVVITGAGFYGFKIASDSSIFNSFSPTDSGGDIQTVSEAGPGVAVIDAAGKKQLATAAATTLLDAGFNVLTARNLDVLTNPGTDLASVVYVRNSSDEDKAKAVAAKLGGLKVVSSKAFADPITVVIGKDFKK